MDLFSVLLAVKKLMSKDLQMTQLHMLIRQAPRHHITLRSSFLEPRNSFLNDLVSKLARTRPSRMIGEIAILVAR